MNPSLFPSLLLSTLSFSVFPMEIKYRTFTFLIVLGRTLNLRVFAQSRNHPEYPTDGNFNPAAENNWENKDFQVPTALIKSDLKKFPVIKSLGQRTIEMINDDWKKDTYLFILVERVFESRNMSFYVESKSDNELCVLHNQHDPRIVSS